MIIDHTNKRYQLNCSWSKSNTIIHNGAYYYSKEIVENIIPRIDTDRNWITIHIPGVACNHSIVFIHNNLHPERYEWLRRYDDLILVCGIPETVDKVAHIGKAIYLPISVDVGYVQSFRSEKTRDVAFVGRQVKRRGVTLPDGIDYIESMPREQLLGLMAKYRSVYAVGRTAIEARVLGCELLPYDPRFPDVSRWEILDNRDAAVMLQSALDEIDGGRNG